MISLFDKMRANRKHWPKEGIKFLEIDHMALAQSLPIGSIWAAPEVEGAPTDRLKVVSVDVKKNTFTYYTERHGPGIQFTGTISQLFEKAMRVA